MEEEVRRRQKEAKRLCRQLDGSRSRSTSLTPSEHRFSLPRADSPSYFDPLRRASTGRVNPLKRVETGSTVSTVSSVPSSISARSTQLRKVEPADQDDRVTARHKAQEQQLRELRDGKDCQQDTASHGGSGQRGFFGRHKSKDPRYGFATLLPGLSTNALQPTLERSTARTDVST